MNYLQLVQRVCQEVGISGTPTTTVGLVAGDFKRVSAWVSTAWDDIQRLSNSWNWMQGSYSFNTTVGTGTYSATDAGITTRFGDWTDYCKCYLLSGGVKTEVELAFLPYEDFRSIYLVGAHSIVRGRPLYFSVGPERSLRLGPLPDQVYVISGQYDKTPQTLSADSDTPEMPEQYHMAIVYQAMIKYARFDAAQEIYQDALQSLRDIMDAMRRTQMPRFSFPGALA